jgi:hypothetical protein
MASRTNTKSRLIETSAKDCYHGTASHSQEDHKGHPEGGGGNLKGNCCSTCINYKYLSACLGAVVIHVCTWIAIIHLYGSSECPKSESSRTSPMCYCQNFTMNWSCMSDEMLDSERKYKHGYFPKIGGNRFSYYFIWSIVENAIFSLVAVWLLGIRIWVTYKQQDKCYVLPLPKDVILRSKSTYKEFTLQWRILLFFSLGSFAHDLFVVVMLLYDCNTSGTVKLRIANALLRIVFKVSVATCLSQEVSIGRESRCNSGRFPKTQGIRSLSIFLAFCSLNLLISKLVASACFENLNNAKLISNKDWQVLTTLFSVTEVGMFGQFFMTFLYIALERSSKYQGHDFSLSIHNLKSFPKLGRGCRLLASGFGFVFVTVVFVLSALLVLAPKESNFAGVSVIQIALHVLLIIFALGLRLYREKTSCKLTKFWENPECPIYTLYFLGALTYNVFSGVIYILRGDDLKDSNRKGVGMAEAFLGLLSVAAQYLVILCLKLLHAPHNGQASGQTGHNSKGNKFKCLLKSFLVISVSLAVVDSLREDFDKDEMIFRKRSALTAVFDALYPFVVDFRLHSAIMVLCMVWEDYVERKLHRTQQSLDDVERKLQHTIKHSKRRFSWPYNRH